MIPLINKTDNQVLVNLDGLKNAFFYRDMLAFYDAYSAFVGYGIKNLPNYCVIDKKIYLDGLCLLIKDYSAMFDFETIDLTLEYLKALYYSLAKYSKNGNLPDRSVIQEEFELRKDTSIELLKKSITISENSKTAYDDIRNRFETQNKINQNKKAKIKNLSKISIIMLMLGILLSAVSIGLGVLKIFEMIISIVVAVVSFVLFILMFILCKKQKSKLINELSLQKDDFEKLKLDKDAKLENYNKVFDKNNKLNVEVYNYIHCYDEVNFKSVTVSNDFLQSATEFNMLSYNLKYDIMTTFESHNNDVYKTVENISNIKMDNVVEELGSIYSEILDKNWLYYNKYVRFALIDKLISSAEKNHIWQININNNYVNPFDINVKEIAEQKVAFLENEKSLFVEMPVSRILKSKIIRDISELKVGKNISADELKEVKIAYAKRFYDYEDISKLGNVFYKNFTDNKGRVLDISLFKDKTLDLTLIKGHNLIPELIDIKIKLVEAKFKIENSHQEIVKQIAEELEKVSSQTVVNTSVAQTENETDDDEDDTDNLLMEFFNEGDFDWTDYEEVSYEELIDFLNGDDKK